MERPRTRLPGRLMPDPDIHVSKTNSKKRTHEQFKPAGVFFKEFDSEPPWKKQTYRHNTPFKEVDSAAPWKLRGRPRDQETAKLDGFVANIGTVSVQGGAASSSHVPSTQASFESVVDAATNPAHFNPRGGLSFARPAFDAVKRSGSPSRVENVSGRPMKDSGGHSPLGQESGRFGPSKKLHHSNDNAKGPKITDYPSMSPYRFQAQSEQPEAHQRQSSPSIYLHHWVPPNFQGGPRASNPQTPSGKSEHDALTDEENMQVNDSSRRLWVSKVAQSKLFVPYTISEDVSRGNSEICNRLCALKKRPSHFEMRKMQIAKKHKCDSNDTSDDSVLGSMAPRKKNAPKEPVQKCCDCDKEFKRPHDLTKHEKAHSHPWKCEDGVVRILDFCIANGVASHSFRSLNKAPKRFKSPNLLGKCSSRAR